MEVVADYSSEVDTFALALARQNWPDSYEMGDIQEVSEQTIKNILHSISFDFCLVIGGCPCKDTSRLKH
eukprot:8964733-Karenia_brevis.AAC.1